MNQDVKAKKTGLPGPATDITEIRNGVGLSRAAFARRYGIPVRTLEHWDAAGAEARSCPAYVRDALVFRVRADLLFRDAVRGIIRLSPPCLSAAGTDPSAGMRILAVCFGTLPEDDPASAALAACAVKTIGDRDGAENRSVISWKIEPGLSLVLRPERNADGSWHGRLSADGGLPFPLPADDPLPQSRDGLRPAAVMRKMSGLSRAGFEERYGVPATTMWNWENDGPCSRSCPDHSLRLLWTLVKADLVRRGVFGEPMVLCFPDGEYSAAETADSVCGYVTDMAGKQLFDRTWGVTRAGRKGYIARITVRELDPGTAGIFLSPP